MIKVLIADDEARDRSFIRILLQQNYPDRFLVREAENGLQALELAQRERFALMLLDVRMPGLNGLELLRQLEDKPYTIVLSAFDRFEYTREALRCGVRDYLLKPPVRAEFYKAIDQFLEAQAQMSEESFQVSRDMFARDLARQLMYYGDRKKIQGLLRVLNITAPWALCGELRGSENREELLEEAESLLRQWGRPYAAARSASGVAVFLFCAEREEERELRETLERLRSVLENDLCVSLRLQTGTLAPNPAGFPGEYLELQKLEETDVQPEDVLNLLEEAVRAGDYGEAMELLRPLLEVPAEEEQRNLLKYRLTSLLSRCAERFLAPGQSRRAQKQISVLIGTDSGEETEEQTARFLHWLMEESASKPTVQDALLQKALELVGEDCAQPWSISALAGRLHVNPSYLGHLFKRRVGQCFTDYLAEQRVKRAELLMRTTDWSLSRIGEAVGYEDSNYFSRVFKKRRGRGPREYMRGEQESPPAIQHNSDL